MANLLSGLKAEDADQYKKLIGHDSDSEDDEAARNYGNRRMSMNKFNDIGFDLHVYQETKPAAGVRREILNMFNEYKESENKVHARDELIAICDQYKIEKYQFVGYFLNNSLAEKPDDFR